MPRTTSPRASALRQGRFSAHGLSYHVIARCALGTQPFSDCDFAFAACRSLHREAQRFDATIHAWILMPDHLHLLVELGETTPLSVAVARYKRSMAAGVNALRETPGVSIWQSGFYDRALRRDDDAQIVADYIIANSVNAKIVDCVGHYPWWNSRWL
jgi:putative transposase